MLMPRILIYLTFLLVGGLSACTDHRVPAVTPGSTTTRLRVKTLTLDLPDNKAKVSAFRYDGQGRLSSILTYQTPDSTVSVIEYNNYQYDGQNRLTQLRREVFGNPRTDPPGVEQYEYSYNAAGQVSGLLYRSRGELIFTVGLGYTATNLLSGNGKRFIIPGIDYRETNGFVFTGNNPTTINKSITVIARGGPPMTSSSTATLTYDDKANPFYGVYVIPAPFPSGFANPTFGPNFIVDTYFGGVDNALNLGKNNVLTQGGGTPQGGTALYQYQYNAADLPTVRVRTTTVGAVATVQTLRFEYESY